ncbi:MAG TPA: hypothetical protein VLG12_08145 [Candidatus Saccharimonadales bacterium]|nr:hypothetical protein [Candidatus Saccharimonadales bacterium]
MPQKITNQNPITETRMKQILKEYSTKKDLENAFKAHDMHMDYKLERLKEDIDEKAREYRDQLMTKLDYIVGELSFSSP